MLPTGYELTGECREPKRGEYFFSPSNGNLIRFGTHTEHPEKAWIAKKKDYING